MSEAKSGILHETLLKVKLAEDGAATWGGMLSHLSR